MIVTPSMIENAKALLSKAPDGSIANTQAITRAKAVMTQHARNLETFLNKNAGGGCVGMLKADIDEALTFAKTIFVFETSWGHDGDVQVIHADDVEQALKEYIEKFGTTCLVIWNDRGEEWHTNNDCSDLWQVR